MTTKEIRHANLLALVVLHGTLAEIAKQTNVSEGYLSQLNTTFRGMGSITARKIEAGYKLPIGWMDLPHTNFAIAYKLARAEALFNQIPADQQDRALRGLEAFLESQIPQTPETR